MAAVIPIPISIRDLPALGPVTLTIGVFDGVHRGHVALLDATRAAAERLACSSVAILFDPPPDEVLHPGSRVPRLAPLGKNVERIRGVGIEHVLAVRFDEALRGLTAEEFLASLAQAMELRALVMSPETAFGRGRTGTVGRLREIGRTQGFEVITVVRVMADGEPISSTRLREAVSAGDIEGARAMGLTPYIEGRVVRGDGRGRELGFPTANLAIGYVAVMPREGVYVAQISGAAVGSDGLLPALVSIGTRPTFHADGAELVEAYLLDFDGDLYGRPLGIELVAYLRDQIRFESVPDLVAQMRRDEDDARRLLSGG
jgi:riboflavin kinase/FMN adenylyltransferase